MKKHEALGTEYDPGAEYMETPAPVTPSKAPKETHRPLAPHKKDGSVIHS
jgi:hypothetical protein